MIDVFMLGSSGTLPLEGRPFSSALVRVEGECILFDCGEGSQIEIQKTGVGFSNISCIAISHLHADHISGLVGILLAIKAANRTKPVTIITPVGLSQYIRSLVFMLGKLPYQLKVIELNRSQIKDFKYQITSKVYLTVCEAKHSVLCFAYSISYIRRPEFLPEKAKSAGIPVQQWKNLAEGKDIEYNGMVYKASEFRKGDRKGLKVSYVTDTRPTNELYQFISNSDIAIIEGMYKENEDKSDAVKNKHMIWSESLRLATGNNVNTVILTHFSPSLQLFPSDLKFVRKLRKNTYLSVAGLYLTLTFDGCSPCCVDKKDSGFLSLNTYISDIVNDRMDDLNNKQNISNYRVKYILKYLEQCGLYKHLKTIKELSSFMFELRLDTESYIVYVYKSKNSMKDNFDTVVQVDDSFLFFKRK